MTQLNLFLQLLDTMNHLLQTEMTSRNIYQSRMNMEDLFIKFDEHHLLDIFKLDNISNIIATQVAQLPKELKQYFQMVETFQVGNETYFQELPPQIEHATLEQFQFIIDFFTLLYTLMEDGMTADSIHHAHTEIDDLLKAFEEQTEAIEDQLRAETNTSNDLPPYLQNALDALTIFPIKERITHGAV